MRLILLLVHFCRIIRVVYVYFIIYVLFFLFMISIDMSGVGVKYPKNCGPLITVQNSRYDQFLLAAND
jgi:hypothetical protein